MKNKILFLAILISICVTIYSFKTAINKKMAVNTINYSFRGIIYSTTTNLMSVSDNGAGTLTITTANGSIVTGDNAIFVLDTSLAFDSVNNTFTIPANSARYWLVPFDGTYSPIDVTNANIADECHKTFCPCDPSKAAIDQCEPQNSMVNGVIITKCVPYTTPNACPACTPVQHQVDCNNINTHYSILDLYNSVYLVRADTIKFNGTTYP